MSQWNTFAVPPYCKRAVMTFPIAVGTRALRGQKPNSDFSELRVH